MSKRKRMPEFGRTSASAQAAPQPAAEPELPRLRAVALVRDGGGHRLVELDLPASVVEECTVRVAEPELISITLALAMESLENAAGVR